MEGAQELAGLLVMRVTGSQLMPPSVERLKYSSSLPSRVSTQAT